MMAANSVGANPSVFDCFLMLRGLKTLEERVIKSTSNAYHLAHFMEGNSAVETISYPGLKNFQFHEVAKKQMRGFGGMITFRVKGGKEQASKFLKAVKVFTLAESLGGVESLCQSPAFMTHASVPAETRAKIGITDNLIRMAVGLEAVEDLVADIDNALKASQL
jgi:cystathionine gamma-lyase